MFHNWPSVINLKRKISTLSILCHHSEQYLTYTTGHIIMFCHRALSTLHVALTKVGYKVLKQDGNKPIIYEINGWVKLEHT